MGKLPATSYVRLVDIWLIFGQLIPFVEVVLFTIVEFYNEDDDINHHGFLRNVSQHKTKISKQGVDEAEIDSNGKMKNISPNGDWIPVDLDKNSDIGRIAKIIDSKVVPAFAVIFTIIYWCVATSL